MTQDRRITDKLPGQPLQWDDNASPSAAPAAGQAGLAKSGVRAAIERALEDRHIEDGSVSAFNDVVDCIEREILAAPVAAPASFFIALEQFKQSDQGAAAAQRFADVVLAAAPVAADTEQATDEQQKECAPPFAAPASQHGADELAALRRFDECAQDGEGYDVPKEMMQRLAEIGVVRRKSGAYYEHTAFGLAVLATRCRAEGGDGAPEAVDVSADRAQQGEPVVCAPNCFYGDCPPCVEAGVAPSATRAAAPDDAPELVKLRERVAYLEAMLDARLERKPDDSQQWTKIDGAIAFHLIERHADDWNDAGRMMDAWRDANRSAPVPDTGIPTAGDVPERVRFLAEWLGDANFNEPWPDHFTHAFTGWMAARRAPASTTPTSGEVEKAEAVAEIAIGPVARFTRYLPALDKLGQGTFKLYAAPSHPSEAKAGRDA